MACGWPRGLSSPAWRPGSESGNQPAGGDDRSRVRGRGRSGDRTAAHRPVSPGRSGVDGADRPGQGAGGRRGGPGQVGADPEQAVLLDGEPTIGWWEIDPATGETSASWKTACITPSWSGCATGPSGLWRSITSFLQGFSTYTLCFIVGVFQTLNTDQSLKQAYAIADALFQQISDLTTVLACAFAWTGIGQFVDCAWGCSGPTSSLTAARSPKRGSSSTRALTPPCEALLSYSQPRPGPAQASALVSVEASLPGTPISATLETGFVALSGTLQLEWEPGGQNALAATELFALDGALYDLAGCRWLPARSGRRPTAPWH